MLVMAVGTHGELERVVRRVGVSLGVDGDGRRAMNMDRKRRKLEVDFKTSVLPSSSMSRSAVWLRPWLLGLVDLLGILLGP